MEKIRILTVDDNPAILRRWTEIFADKEDMELVGSAMDGLEALDSIRALKPDMLLLDIIMPRLDGFAVLEKLRAIEHAPRAIMVSGLSRDDFVARAMLLGASYYMVKPVDPGVLLARIRDVARMDRAQAIAAEPLPGMRKSADEQVTNIFLSIGIPAHIKGYQYLREAVRMVVDNHDVINRITKELYPGIARRYQTTPSKVERAMRHAIEVAWNRGRLESVNRLYGSNVFSPEDKPTNGEFIAMIADRIAMAKSA